LEIINRRSGKPTVAPVLFVSMPITIKMKAEEIRISCEKILFAKDLKINSPYMAKTPPHLV